MKKHLILVCTSYLAIGIGVTVKELGIKAGLGLYPTITIFGVSIAYFLIITLTSLEKIKKVLFEHEQKKKAIDATTIKQKA